METPNIQLYNFLRHDFRLTSAKCMEFMNILHKEYKSAFKEDFVTLEKKMEGLSQEHVEFKTSISETRAEFNAGFNQLRGELQVGLAGVRKDLSIEISNVRKELAVEIAGVRKDLSVEIAGVRKDLNVGFAGVRKDLGEDINKSKLEMIRWLFALFLALALMILGIYLKK